MKDGELLDLVGNAEHEDTFKKMVQQVKAILDRQPNQKDATVTINKVVGYFRKKAETKPDFFPYLAIKVCLSMEKNDLVQFSTNRSEYFQFGMIRQLCVFEEGKERIKFTKFTFPKEYTEEYRKGTKNEQAIRVVSRNIKK